MWTTWRAEEVLPQLKGGVAGMGATAAGMAVQQLVYRDWLFHLGLAIVQLCGLRHSSAGPEQSPQVLMGLGA